MSSSSVSNFVCVHIDSNHDAFLLQSTWSSKNTTMYDEASMYLHWYTTAWMKKLAYDFIYERERWKYAHIIQQDVWSHHIRACIVTYNSIDSSIKMTSINNLVVTGCLALIIPTSLGTYRSYCRGHHSFCTDTPYASICVHHCYHRLRLLLKRSSSLNLHDYINGFSTEEHMVWNLISLRTKYTHVWQHMHHAM